LKFIHRNGAVGFYCEAYPLYYMTAPQLYLATQLLWKIDQDPAQILCRYFADLYGPAASDIEAFYAALERYWTQPRQGRWFQGLDNIRRELEIANPSILEDARKHLVAAKQKVIGNELARVQYIESGFRFSYAVVRAYQRTSSLETMPLSGEKDLAALVAEIEAALGDIRVAEDTYRDVISRDPLQKHTYYVGERFENKFRAWRECNADNLRRAVARVRESCHKSIPPDAAQVIIDDLHVRLSEDPIAQKLGLADWK